MTKSLQDTILLTLKEKFENRRIVFWYDENGDTGSIFDGVDIDGREGFACAFDGVPADHIHPWQLKLTDVRRMDDDSVWIRYKVK